METAKICRGNQVTLEQSIEIANEHIVDSGICAQELISVHYFPHRSPRRPPMHPNDDIFIITYTTDIANDDIRIIVNGISGIVHAYNDL
jgi:hypothetical protein